MKILVICQYFHPEEFNLLAALHFNYLGFVAQSR